MAEVFRTENANGQYTASHSSRIPQPVIIEDLEFDALMAQEQTLENTVPQYVTDEGFMVSDAIINESEKLDMLLVISELPITWRDRHGTSETRLSDSIEKLKEFYFAKKPVTVITHKETYENMAITSISISEDDKNCGRTLEIPISFEKIRITSTKQVENTLPKSNGKSGATKKANGTPKTQKKTAVNSDFNSTEDYLANENGKASRKLVEATKKENRDILKKTEDLKKKYPSLNRDNR